MNVSESEIVALMAITVLLNGVGLLTWRRGLLGHCYPITIGLSMLALLADPMSLPGVAGAGAIAAMLLGALASLCPSGTAWAEPWGGFALATREKAQHAVPARLWLAAFSDNTADGITTGRNRD
jgi:hypothetical protein